jgi:hypothetical protein
MVEEEKNQVHANKVSRSARCTRGVSTPRQRIVQYAQSVDHTRATTYSPAKVLTFAICNIFVGILQVWISLVALAAIGKNYSIGLLLGDGGLFFLPAPVIVNSFLILEDSGVPRCGWDTACTLLAILLSLVSAVAAYTAVFTNRIGQSAPFHGPMHIASQISCAILALAYAIYVAVRTGHFWK